MRKVSFHFEKLMNENEDFHKLKLWSVLVFVWVMSHPYFGIVHDGVLYLAQALRHISPGAVDADLFFQYGSQDAYTVFPALYATLIRCLGLGSASVAAILFCQAAFVACLVFLCVSLFGRKYGLLSACMVAVMPRYYGGYDIFSYSETFFTARSLAEPLCLLSMAQLLAGRNFLSLFFLFVAALMHPLVAFPCMLVWMLDYLRAKTWLYFASFPVLVLSIFLLRAHPLGEKILTVYDDQWWGVVRERDIFVFPTYWRITDWVAIFLDVFLIYSVSKLTLLSVRAKELLWTLLTAVLIAMVVSIVGTTSLRSVLITGLQLWRVDWMLHLMAMASIPVLLVEIWKRGELARTAFFYFGCAAWYYKSITFIIPFGAGLALLYISRKEILVQKRVNHLLLLGVGLIFLAGVAGSGATWSLMLSGEYFLVNMNFIDRLKMVFFDPGFTKLILFIVSGLFICENGKKLTLLVCAALMSIGGLLADRRTPFQTYIESNTGQKGFESVPLGPHDQIYWHNNPLGPWVLFGRPSFYTFTQGSGVLFSRGTALEFQTRRHLLGLQNQFSFDTESTAIDVYKQVEPKAMVKACELYPQLKTVVLPNPVPNAKGFRWVFPHQKAEETEDLYVFQCADLVRL